MSKDWTKFTSMGGGFQDIFIGDGIDFKNEDDPIIMEASIGTFSGGGTPRWTKKFPKYKSDAEKRLIKEKEKMKVEKKMAKLRQKIDLIIHNEMRRLGYTKVED